MRVTLLVTRNSNVNRVVRWLPAVGMMAVIYLSSATPASEIPTYGGWDDLVKKGGHFFGYGLLALMYLFALNGYRPRILLSLLGLVALYAVTDEFHQFFTPGRHASLVDVGIDVLGALFCLAAWMYFRGRIRKTIRKEQETS